MVSLNISDYEGFDLLQKFEQNWSEIHGSATLTGDEVKKLQITLSNAKKKYMKMNSSCDKFFANLELITYIVESLDKLAGKLGKLQGEFRELEKVLSFLESVCDEGDEVEKILSASEEVHALKITRQKELEELKAALAKEHATYLETMQKDRIERKMTTEKAIHSAIWSGEPNPPDENS